METGGASVVLQAATETMGAKIGDPSVYIPIGNDDFPDTDDDVIADQCLYGAMNACVKLIGSNRSSDPDLLHCLNATRTGNFDEKARKLINSRVLGNNSAATLPPAGTPGVFFENANVNAWAPIARHYQAIENGVKLYRLPAYLTKSTGEHVKPGDHPWYDKPAMIDNSEGRKTGPVPYLDFDYGDMVTVNVGDNSRLAKFGIGNGSVAEIVGVYPPQAGQHQESTVHVTPTCTSKVLEFSEKVKVVLLKIHQNTAMGAKGFKFPGLDDNVYPLAPQAKTFHGVKISYFPIRHRTALTVHKSQGQTMTHLFIDLPPERFTYELFYTAMSRCTTLEGITIFHPFTPHLEQRCKPPGTLTTAMAKINMLDGHTQQLWSDLSSAS